MKEKLLSGFALLVSATVVLGLAGCGESVRHVQQGNTFYTRYNCHYYTKPGKTQRLAAIQSWTQIPNHAVMPYNTQVSVKLYGRGFVLTDVKNGEPVYVECKKKYLGNYTLNEYLDLVLSDTPVEYSNLSEVDRQGIASGRALKEMSKKGVMIALGYPLPDRVPNEQADKWSYWKGRFEEYIVEFQDGKVVEIYDVMN